MRKKACVGSWICCDNGSQSGHCAQGEGCRVISEGAEGARERKRGRGERDTHQVVRRRGRAVCAQPAHAPLLAVGRRQHAHRRRSRDDPRAVLARDAVVGVLVQAVRRERAHGWSTRGERVHGRGRRRRGRCWRDRVGCCCEGRRCGRWRRERRSRRRREGGDGCRRSRRGKRSRLLACGRRRFLDVVRRRSRRRRWTRHRACRRGVPRARRRRRVVRRAQVRVRVRAVPARPPAPVIGDVGARVRRVRVLVRRRGRARSCRTS